MGDELSSRGSAKYARAPLEGVILLHRRVALPRRRLTSNMELGVRASAASVEGAPREPAILLALVVLASERERALLLHSIWQQAIINVAQCGFVGSCLKRPFQRFSRAQDYAGEHISKFKELREEQLKAG